MESQKAYTKKKRVTLIGALINLILSLTKYIIGVLSGSPVLIADAIHSIGDYITDITVLAGLKFSSMPPDEDHPYGHGKFETIASLVVGLALVVTAGFLIYNGLITLIEFINGKSFISEEYHWAFFVALVSVILKEWLYRYTLFYGQKLNSSSLIANAYHHRSDSYSSIGALIGIASAYIFPKLSFMDPLASVVVAFFIGYIGWKILKPTLSELVDTAPEKGLLSLIQKIAEETAGVLGSRRVRSRSIGNDMIVDLEIYVEPALSLYEAHDISELVKENIFNSFPKVREVLVHVEPDKNIVESLFKEKKELIKQINDCVRKVKEIKSVNNIRFYRVPQGLEVNLDVVVNPYITVEEGHNISERLEEELHKVPSIHFVHVHLEFENKLESFGL